MCVIYERIKMSLDLLRPSFFSSSFFVFHPQNFESIDGIQKHSIAMYKLKTLLYISVWLLAQRVYVTH